jgi:hypothetical protein
MCLGFAIKQTFLHFTSYVTVQQLHTCVTRRCCFHEPTVCTLLYPLVYSKAPMTVQLVAFHLSGITPCPHNSYCNNRRRLPAYTCVTAFSCFLDTYRDARLANCVLLSEKGRNTFNEPVDFMKLHIKIVLSDYHLRLHTNSTVLA